METLFADCPEAISNTLEIAERCGFDLASDLGYTLPEPDVPYGYTPMSYLMRLCYEAAVRRYGSITERGGESSPGGVPAYRAQRDGGLPAAVPRNSPSRETDHGGARTGRAGGRTGGATPRPRGAARRSRCWRAISSASATSIPSGGI